MYLDQNMLSGTIPTEFAGLEELQVLNLSSKNLNGEIPQDVCKLEDLERLIVDCFAINCHCCAECPAG